MKNVFESRCWRSNLLHSFPSVIYGCLLLVLMLIDSTSGGLESNINRNFLLAYGNHKWAFRFFLNESLPPTVKQTKPSDSFIHYLLKITFVRIEWFKKNIEQRIPIVVRHLSSSFHSKKIEAEEKTRTGIHLCVILQNSTIIAGKKHFILSRNQKSDRNPNQSSIGHILPTHQIRSCFR